MVKLKPEYLRWINRGKALLRHADDLIVSVGAIEYGTTVEKFLGVGSVGFTLLSVISPDGSPQSVLTDSMGYEEVDTPINAFICDLLLKSKLERKEVRISDSERFVFWAAGVAAIYDRDQCISGPFIKEGIDLKEVLAPAVWKGKDLVLSVSEEVVLRKGGKGKSQVKYGISPMDPPGFYIGTPSVEYIADRMGRYKGNRAVMFVGPTGTGKSTLARLVSHKLYKDAKILEVTGEIVKIVKKDGLLDVARYLAPDVMIIDDVQNLFNSSKSGTSSEVLSLIELLHHRVKLTFATLMQDWQRYTHGRHGKFYYSGMRPGRIDEIHELRPPSKRTRERILKHYMETDKLPPGLVEASHSLTGAYLMELASRISTHGVAGWKRELAQLKLMAPKISTPKRSKTIKKVNKLLEEIAWKEREYILYEETETVAFDILEKIPEADLDAISRALTGKIKDFEGLADQQDLVDQLETVLDNLKKRQKGEEGEQKTDSLEGDT